MHSFYHSGVPFGIIPSLHILSQLEKPFRLWKMKLVRKTVFKSSVTNW